MSAAVVETGEESATTQRRVAARREQFRAAIARLSERAQSAELLRMLLLPAAFAVIAGFGFMVMGWWGASRTFREIEQIPYLISGGLIGLGLVFVGGLVLASALWMMLLQRSQEESEERHARQLRELEERLEARIEAGGSGSRATRARPRRASSRQRPSSSKSSRR